MVNIEGLSFGYGRGALFQELALGLAPGNIYGLLGVNGAGKSTLLKLISGLAVRNLGQVRSLGYDPAARQPSFLLDVFVLPEDAQAPNMLAARLSAGARAVLSALRSRAVRPLYPRVRAAGGRQSRGALARSAEEVSARVRSRRAKRSSCCSTSRPTGSTSRRRACCGASSPRRSTDDRLFVISTHQVRDLGTLMDPIVILHQGRVLLNRTLAEIGARVRMTHQSSAPAGRLAGPAVQRAGHRRLLVGVARRRRRAARSRGAVQRHRRETGACTVRLAATGGAA